MCLSNQSPVTSDLRIRGISLIPADLNASIPPSCLSRIVTQATNSQPIDSIIEAALRADPPVVVTSSSKITLSPDLIVEPRYQVGFQFSFLLFLWLLPYHETPYFGSFACL